MVLRVFLVIQVVLAFILLLASLFAGIFLPTDRLPALAAVMSVALPFVLLLAELWWKSRDRKKLLADETAQTKKSLDDLADKMKAE